MCVGLAAGEMALVTHWSEPASAKNGNSGGNGGGNGGGPGNGGGNSGNAGGGNNGGSNAGGNGSAHGNPGGKGAPPAGPQAQPPEDTDIALGLRNAGRIRALADVYAAAERQFGGKVIDARLVRDQRSGWIYDVRLVTEDGQLHDVAYRATNLALVSIDGEPVD